MEQGARQPLQHAAEITIETAAGTPINIRLDKVIPEIPAPATTKYIKHERIQSDRLTKFWGRPMHLGAHILLPEGFDTHPTPRYPLVIFHGHFPQNFGGFREGRRMRTSSPITTSGSIWPGTTRSSRTTPIASTRSGPGQIFPHGHHRDPARESFL